MMKFLHMVEPEEPLSQAQLAAFEKEYGFILPNTFKEHLLRYNGGHPKQDGIPLIEPIDGDKIRGSEHIVNWFLALYKGEHSNLEWKIRFFKDRIPDDCIPIADLGGGDKLCLCIRGERYGKVYVWDHNWETEEPPPDYSNMYLVANSFEDFINSLTAGEILDTDPVYNYRIIYDRPALPFMHFKHFDYGQEIINFFTAAPSDVDTFYVDYKTYSLNEGDGPPRVRAWYKLGDKVIEKIIR